MDTKILEREYDAIYFDDCSFYHVKKIISYYDPEKAEYTYILWNCHDNAVGKITCWRELHFYCFEELTLTALPHN